MKAISLESVYETLRDEPAHCLVTVPEAVRQRAAAAMLRMIDLSA
jgi:quinolinate synthase